MSFKKLEPEDFLISADSITAGAWVDANPTLTEFYTASVQKASTSGEYYYSIYQENPSSNTARVQFNLAFGNSKGSGSIAYDGGIIGKSPTSTIYGQWRNIVLGDENASFTFGGVTPITQSINVIAVERSKYKGNIFPGTLDLRLKSPVHNGVLRLTDNSNDVPAVSFNEAGRVYQLVSGSAGSSYSGTGYSEYSGSYGLFLPDVGAIILNTSALELAYGEGGGISFTSSLTNDGNADNNDQLFACLNGGENFTLNSQENITSDFIFVRARNSEYNYSENPSFISGSTGEVIFGDFINSPQTFITTVGLYNDTNELLAVAKLSKPLKKDFTKEALIRVKLDF